MQVNFTYNYFHISTTESYSFWKHDTKLIRSTFLTLWAVELNFSILPEKL